MHHGSHTLTGMEFPSAFYHTSDFSWLKVYFPIHYPTINVFIFPNMLALCLMVLVTHYAQNYASIYNWQVPNLHTKIALYAHENFF